MIKFITVLSKNNPNKQYAYYQTLKKNTTVNYITKYRNFMKDLL